MYPLASGGESPPELPKQIFWAKLPAPARPAAFFPISHFPFRNAPNSVDIRPQTGEFSFPSGRIRCAPTNEQSKDGLPKDGKFQGRIFMDQRRFTLRPQYEFTKSEPVTKIQPEVTVNLGEILPILADALAHDRAWLADFAKDPITISRDLQEILLAYKAFRRSPA